MSFRRPSAGPRELNFFSEIAARASRKCSNLRRRSNFGLALVKIKSTSVRFRPRPKSAGHSLANFINMNESIVSW